MKVERLKLTNFRCFSQNTLTAGARLNIITGDNASGKSSVLEAIFMLGRGQSFRNTSSRSNVREGCEGFTLFADVSDSDERKHRVAVSRAANKHYYRLDSRSDVSRLDLVNTLPLQFIDPNVHRLLEHGPRYRRHFMDWGVFHVEHVFFPAWKRYRRALKQRNHALRARWPKKDLITWDAELVEQAQVIDACRRAYIEELDKMLASKLRQLLGASDVELHYASGWRRHTDLGEQLAANLEKDRRAGSTQLGPHRADLKIMSNEQAARDWVSRGQQKILTVGLLLAQVRVLQARRGLAPILLFDDIAAELGHEYRKSLLTEIESLGGQCFMTFLDRTLVPDWLKEARTFHVEPDHTIRRIC